MYKCAALLVLLGVGLLARSTSDFWKEKAYTQWTDDEITRMLSDSPWAQSSKANTQGSRQGMGRQGGGMGRRGGWGYPGGGYPGGGGGYPGSGEWTPQFTATIRWQTALPVREALLRQSGSTKTDDSSVLTAPVTSYVIAVLGVPETLPSSGRGRYGRRSDDDRSREDRDADLLDRLKSATYLSRKDKASIFPEKVARAQDGTTILFTFARSAPISLDDKEVEFVTRFGPAEIKHKFKLKDMVYQGRLEL